jgi:hypothetical protein
VRQYSISSVRVYLDGFGYEAGDMAGGAELDDLLHVPDVLVGVGAEGASVGVRVHGVVHAALLAQRTNIRCMIREVVDALR